MAGLSVPAGANYHDLVNRILLARPRGYCAGVERAIDTVELALDRSRPARLRPQADRPQPPRRADLESKGAVFVDDEREIPEGAVFVLSAHGVAPEVHANAAARGLKVIDATCPLVTKVHLEARRFAPRGATILLIGHAGHEEVVGTTGHAPDRTSWSRRRRKRATVTVDDPERVAYLCRRRSRSTRRREIIDVLRRPLPHAPGSAQRGHLLRDPEPPGRREGHGGRAPTSCWSSVRRTRRTRTGWSRWRGAPGTACASDRRRARHRPRVAARRGGGRPHGRARPRPSTWSSAWWPS